MISLLILLLSALLYQCQSALLQQTPLLNRGRRLFWRQNGEFASSDINGTAISHVSIKRNEGTDGFRLPVKLKYLWPRRRALQLRLVASLSALLIGKAITISLPFHLQNIVKEVSSAYGIGAESALQASAALAIVYYVASRALAGIFTELKGFLFIAVSQVRSHHDVDKNLLITILSLLYCRTF